MAHNPCSADPDLWFGYADDDGGDGAAKARAYEMSATQARSQCLRKCPLAQQRMCAQRAVEQGEEYGVWAGIKLPGNQYRKRHQLADAHDTLRRIAAGEINPRELPESVDLLTRSERQRPSQPAAPVMATVHRFPLAVVSQRSVA